MLPGATFSKISYDPQLKVPVCQATVWRSPQNGDVYYSGPDDLPSSNTRTHGTVRRSKSGLPGSWQAKKTEITMPCTVSASACERSVSPGLSRRSSDDAVPQENKTKCSADRSVAFGYAVLTDVPAKGKGGVLWESVGGTVFSTFELDF